MSSQPKTCAMCSAPLYYRNRSGYCARHQNSCPEKRARVSASLKRGFRQDPERRAALSRAGKASANAPGEHERRAERARNLRLWERGAAARTTETYAQIGRSVSNTRMSWCPPDLRGEARRLTKKKGLPLAEVQEIILAQHDAEIRRFRRALGVEEAAETVNEPALRTDRLPRAMLGKTDDATAAEIVAAISEAFGFAPEQVTGKGRRSEIIPARRTCSYVLSRIGNSYATVGRWLGGRDHSTIIHACHQFETLATPAMRAFADRFIGRAA